MKTADGTTVIHSLRAGHPKTLFSAFAYFDVSFMIWMLIGALGVLIAQDLHLTPFQKGILVAVPLLGGAVFRIILGLLSDHFGPRKVGLACLFLTLVPLGWGWLGGKTFSEMLAIGLLLGIAGASFAVALPLVSRWYPSENQGIALGIAGAGNSGTLFAIFLAPMLAVTYGFGWHGVFGLAILPVLLVWILFAVLSKEAPGSPAPQGLRPYLELLRNQDLWWFCFFYSITFGGFVGLTSSLGLLYHDHYGTSALTAGKLTAVGTLAGSFFRPVGGYLSDRFGGFRVLSLLFLLSSFVFVLFGGLLPPLSLAIPLVAVGVLALGMSNGAVFQLVPQRFPARIGIVSGIVGAAGGLGGFCFSVFLGAFRGFFHADGAGFILLGSIALLGAGGIAFKRRSWQSWAAPLQEHPERVPDIPDGSRSGRRVPMEVVFGG